MSFKPDYEGEDGSVSKFNEAYFKMMRLHEIQKVINDCSTNILAFNIDYGVYNYELIFKSLNQLLLETWSKIKKEQKEESVKFKQAIEIFLLKYPIIINKKDSVTGEPIVKINKSNQIILENWLFKYQSMIKEYLGKVGYDSPNYEDTFDVL